MRATHLFAGVAVSDFVIARDWYERLFGAPPDVFPKEGEAVWHLGPSTSIYVVADPDRAGHGLVTLAVENLDSQRLRAIHHGLAAVEGRETNGPRTVTVTDPDGNTIKFFEDPARA